MKTSNLVMVCSALLLGVSAGAAPERLSLRIIQTDEPTFPLALQGTQVLNGDARVMVDVDEHGKLIECLVTGYSRKEFADAAVEALRRWRYEPPSLNGEPWASVREISFDYSRTGVVVSLTAGDVIGNHLEELMPGRYAYRTHTLRELDRIPTPVKVVSPEASVADGRKHTVTVEFFIDEEGRVRVPSVARAEAGSIYAASALDAVRQWRFDPPTVKGRPVLVLAAQQFNFVPKG